MSQIFNLKRKVFTEKSTIGELYGPDGAFWCHTLEDVVRNQKVYGKTAIPSGFYEVIVGWSPHYQRPMPRILKIPFYEGCLIHPGNTADNSEGCILVGKYDPNIADFIGVSRDTFDRIFPLIRKLTEHDSLFLTIEGGFEAKDWITPDPVDQSVGGIGGTKVP